MKKNIFRLTVIALISILSFNSCKKDQILDDSNATLVFSEDTIKFDTVFTSVGSATQVFTVRNTYNQALRISSLNLAGGAGSNYRLNVNGTPGKYFSNVEIGANDSIWIFVEVTVDPNNLNTPLIVEDAIIFNTNGHVQNLPLTAYGQDAHFYPSSNCGEQKSRCTPLFKLKDCNGTSNSLHWINDKPYVIDGYAILDSGYTLTVDPGVRIHFNTNSGLIVLNTAKLIVNGTLADPVTFQGARLGEAFKDIPGQWDRIWFSTITSIDLSVCPVNDGIVTGKGPSGNIINYAIIKNGYVGIQSDSLVPSVLPAITINNTIMKNFASTAFYGQGSSVAANNCVFANSGEYLGALYYGGAYSFLHCTFANYWSNSNRTTPSLYFQNYYNTIRPLNAYFGNCIIYGNQDNEVALDSFPVSGHPEYFDFKFDHTLFKMDNETFGSGGSHYPGSIRNSDPRFKNIDINYYKVDSTSIAVNLGLQSITDLNPTVLGTDIEGKTRPAAGTSPDAGAYEDDNQ